MIASKTALCRSLDVIERLVGAAVIERTRGKGLIQITPLGEAVLEWWSRFYMLRMPISPNSGRIELGRRSGERPTLRPGKSLPMFLHAQATVSAAHHAA